MRVLHVLKNLSVGAFIAGGLVSCSNPSPDQYDLKSSIVEGVNYIGISVSDLDQATAFYSTPANLNIIEEPEPVSASFKSQLLRSVNTQLRLMEFSEPQSRRITPVQGPGIAHVCVQATKDTDAYGKFLASGGTSIGSPEMVQLRDSVPVEYAYVNDLDGNIIEVEHVDVEALNLPAPPKNTHRIRHIALATPDLERLVDFYSDLLDEPKPRRIGRLFPFGGDKIDKVSGLEDSKIKMAWFQIRNLELELAQYFSHPTETPATPRPVSAIGFNMIVFDVNDLDAAKEKFISAGGALESLSPDLDDDIMFFGRDPDGNLLGFQDVPDSSVYSSQNFANDGAE